MTLMVALGIRKFQPRPLLFGCVSVDGYGSRCGDCAGLESQITLVQYAAYLSSALPAAVVVIARRG